MISKNNILIVDLISNQNVPLSLHTLVAFVLHLLEPRIAIILPTIAAVAIVLTASPSLVSPLTRSLELDSGNTQHFALQKAVAAKVSGDESGKMFLFHRCCHLAKPPWRLPRQP